MRFMTGHAPAHFDRHVFERERPTLVSMTVQASGLVGMNECELRPLFASVRRVATHTVHRISREAVAERPLEPGALRYVTGGAQVIRRLPEQGRFCRASMNRVAGRACHGLARMGVEKTITMDGFVLVAVQASRRALPGRQ